MESRMKKYYTEEFKPDAKRTAKNAEMYKKVYGSYNEFEDLKLPVSENEIEITNFNKEITSREEYRKMKQDASITNPNVKPKIEKQEIQSEISNEHSKNKAQKIYDINVLLAKAKKEIKELDKDAISTKDYLHTLQTDEQIKTDLEKVKEKYEKKEKEYKEKEKIEQLNTESLSLELLSDLKSDDNTEVIPPLKSENVSKEADDSIAHKIEDESDKFYSKTYDFKKEDFTDDDFYDNELKNGSYVLKVVLLLIGIIALIILILFLIDYSGLVNIIP